MQNDILKIKKPSLKSGRYQTRRGASKKRAYAEVAVLKLIGV